MPRVLKVLTFGAVLVAVSVGLAEAPAQDPIPLRAPEQDPIPLPLPPRVAQPVAQPGAPAEGDEPEVLAKGPVHEAFAATAEAPVEAPIIEQRPPDPIEELPPEQKPDGDNVQWMPGYWHWDDDNDRFIWVSGFWRQMPPGRVWVPGSWREVRGGWQYVSGFFQEVPPAVPGQQQPVQPEIEYLPQPPVSVETGPVVPAPTATSFYIPGSWVWRQKYVWRPGVWVEHRANWIWVPARYVWTPAGYVFCDGHWDHLIATRGVLFAPVVFPRPVLLRPRYVYTPVYVVSEPCMVGALFVRRGHGHYFFGDYFEARYATRGFGAWCGTVTPRGGFTIGFGVGRTWGYDPLWSHYSIAYRTAPAWRNNINDVYGGRFAGTVARPPVTLVQQNTVINNITKVNNVTNVTNNITIVNGAPTVNNTNVANVAMLAPLKVAPDLTKQQFRAVNAEARKSEAVAAQQLREVAAQRQRLETFVAKSAPAVTTPPVGQPAVQVKPQTVRLDVPKAAAAKAVATVQDEKKAPPPNPIRAAKVDTKVEPKFPVTPKIEPKTPVVPKIEPKLPVNPKVDPKLPINPKIDPMPKVDPKLPVNPKIVPNPKVNPKVDPKIEPKVPVVPKIEPKVPVVPKVDPMPKIEPKIPVVPKVEPKLPPVVQPKVEPKLPPVVLPKVEPKLPPVTQPKLPPVTQPPGVPKLPPVALPPPKVEPKLPPVTLPPVQPKLPPVTLPPKGELPKLPPVTLPPPKPPATPAKLPAAPPKQPTPVPKAKGKG